MSNWGQQPPPGPYGGPPPVHGQEPWGPAAGDTAQPGWQGHQQQAGPYGQYPAAQAPSLPYPGTPAPYEPYPGTQGSYGQPGAGPQGFASPPGPAFIPQAAKPGVMPLRPQNLGDIFDAAFQTIRGNPAGSIGTVVVGGLLLSLLTAGLMVVSVAADSGERAGTALIIIVLLAVPFALVAGLAAVGGLVHVFAQAIMGRRASVGAALRVGVRRMWAMLGLSLLMGLVMFVLLVPLIAISLATGSSDSSSGAMVFLVMIVGIATGCANIWAFIRSSFSAHVVVMEKVGPVTALKRSWQLTRGRFWRTFGINLLAQVIVTAISWALQTVLSLLLVLGLGVGVASGGSDSRAGLGVMIATGVISVVLTLLSYAFIYPFTTNVMGALYVDARIRDEGLAGQLMHLPSDPMAARVHLAAGALDFPLPGGSLGIHGQQFAHPTAGPFFQR